VRQIPSTSTGIYEPQFKKPVFAALSVYQFASQDAHQTGAPLAVHVPHTGSLFALLLLDPAGSGDQRSIPFIGNDTLNNFYRNALVFVIPYCILIAWHLKMSTCTHHISLYSNALTCSLTPHEPIKCISFIGNFTLNNFNWNAIFCNTILHLGVAFENVHIKTQYLIVFKCTCTFIKHRMNTFNKMSMFDSWVLSSCPPDAQKNEKKIKINGKYWSSYVSGEIYCY